MKRKEPGLTSITCHNSVRSLLSEKVIDVQPCGKTGWRDSFYHIRGVSSSTQPMSICKIIYASAILESQNQSHSLIFESALLVVPICAVCLTIEARRCGRAVVRC